jgi:hypothetical protein
MLELIGLLLAIMTFYFSYKPLCHIEFWYNIDWKTYIKILNKWNAPMILKTINFKKDEFLKTFKNALHEVILNENRPLKSSDGDEFILFSIESNNKKEELKQALTSSLNKSIILEIQYTNIFIESILPFIPKKIEFLFYSTYTIDINYWNEIFTKK